MAPPQSVLVLGATGMLGAMVTRYLSVRTPHDVWASIRSGEDAHLVPLPAERVIILDANAGEAALASIFAAVRPAVIVNCIGVIKPHCRDDDPPGVWRAIQVNTLFPYRLAAAARAAHARVIQIATDCVFSGKTGNYEEGAPHDAEDVYGKTKSLGEVRAPHVLHIRCSIIGPERRTHASLFDWFLRQPEKSSVRGFSHHRWNGVTTLQFAECCAALLGAGSEAIDRLARISSVHHFVPNQAVTKYELLATLARVFRKDVAIEERFDIGPVVDRTLTSRYHTLPGSGGQTPLELAVKNLQKFMSTMKEDSLSDANARIHTAQGAAAERAPA